MSFLETKTGIASVGIATVASIATLLAIKYPDCAVFDTNHKSVAYKKGVPLFGNLFQIIAHKDRMFEYITETYEELDTLTYRSSQCLMASVVNTCDPVNIEHVIKTNFENYEKGGYMYEKLHELFGDGILLVDGEDWKKQRKTSSRIFHVKNFRDKFTSVFLKEIDILCTHIFDKLVESKEEVDFQDTMYRLTMDSFAELAFSVKLDSLLGKADFAEAFDATQHHSVQRFIVPFIHTYETMKHYLYYFSEKKSVKQQFEVMNNLSYSIIRERRANAHIEKADIDLDILDRFMKTTDEHGEPCSDAALRDTVMNFIIAGRDTTAVTLSWTIHSLLDHPQVEETLVKEIFEHITDEVQSDPVVLYEAIQKMPYTQAVLHEVLRLYPGVPGTNKKAVADDIWPDGTHVKKGDGVGWQAFAQGRMTKIWGPDAKEFKPQRWIDEEGKFIRVSPYKWMAFSAGPRVCIGQNLAVLEVIVVLVVLLKRYKFKRVPGHKVEFLNIITLAMKNGLKVTVEKRQ